VARKALLYSDSGDEPDGALVLFRDITDEKRAQSINNAMLRISMALPACPGLEDLLDYISS
jgi:hypothetical protein